MSKGRVTIPTDENFVEETKRIAELWGADAVAFLPDCAVANGKPLALDESCAYFEKCDYGRGRYELLVCRDAETSEYSARVFI